MKILKTLVAVLFPLFLFTGCIKPTTPQIAYAIGEEHTFGTVKVKLDLDDENEQFILYYNVSEQNTEVQYFSFSFHKSPAEYLKNSDQFEYTDNLGSKIEFNKNGDFTFYGSRIFYISYRNADNEIKHVIDNKSPDCSIALSMGTFAFFDYPE